MSHIKLSAKYTISYELFLDHNLCNIRLSRFFVLNGRGRVPGSVWAVHCGWTIDSCHLWAFCACDQCLCQLYLQTMDSHSLQVALKRTGYCCAISLMMPS